MPTMPTVYEIITERILELMETGTVPWKKPWDVPEPKNLISKKVYRGINYFLLSSVGSEYFLTFNQIKTLNGSLRKGSKSYPVIFWKPTKYTTKDDPDEEKTGLMLRYYTVFSVGDVEGITVPITSEIPSVHTSIEIADKLITEMPDAPTIVHEGAHAFYSPVKDSVTVPPKEKFFASEAYYGTLFHELIHSTGHKSRLARKGVTDSDGFGSQLYGEEELIAEMGAAYLCGIAHINSVLENNAAYIKGWMDSIKANPKLLISAAGKAQRAVDFITGKESMQEIPA